MSSEFEEGLKIAENLEFSEQEPIKTGLDPILQSAIATGFYQEFPVVKDATKPYPNEYVHGAQKPSVGRIVHYYSKYYAQTARSLVNGPFAAVITSTEENDRQGVNISFWARRGASGGWAINVPYRDFADHKRDEEYWEWPPKV